MADRGPGEPKTNWPLLVWPILVLWGIIWVVVPHTEFREQAHVVAPILMVAAAFLVILAHAVAGSITQRRTLWGCILCPPYIVWAWLHRQREMAKFRGSTDPPGAQS